MDADLMRLADHYAAMARNPASVDQARHSVAWLMREWPDVFGELGEMVREALK